VDRCLGSKSVRFVEVDAGAGYSGAAYLDTTPIRRQINHAAQLRGQSRYEAFGRIELTLARTYAPLAAYAYLSNIDLFSARIGCQTYVPGYGIDLTRLCTR
jgi:hypothetical protein